MNSNEPLVEEAESSLQGFDEAKEAYFEAYKNLNNKKEAIVNTINELNSVLETIEEKLKSFEVSEKPLNQKKGKSTSSKPAKETREDNKHIAQEKDEETAKNEPEDDADLFDNVFSDDINNIDFS